MKDNLAGYLIIGAFNLLALFFILPLSLLAYLFAPVVILTILILEFIFWYSILPRMVISIDKKKNKF
jgi:hypothetical protein